MITFVNTLAAWEIDTVDFTCRFIDCAGEASLEPRAEAAGARVRVGERWHPVTGIEATAEGVALTFACAGVTVALSVFQRRHDFIVEVERVDGVADEVIFLDQPLEHPGTLDAPFAACALALNTHTHVSELPGPMRRLQAGCTARFGLVGAQISLIACPTVMLRDILQEVVSAAPALPKNTAGGPWALDAPENRGSYIMVFGGIRLDEVDDWIALCRETGFTQLDFHCGDTWALRFGDLAVNRTIYPGGDEELKAVFRRLRDAGISLGLHTYAFFLSKQSRYVTPVPDRRLAASAVFTLAAELPADRDTIRVNESTADVSTVTGFFVRNSVTLRIDDELITFTGITPDGVFTGCMRGAYGTTPALHHQGAQAAHLKECFGLFVPDADTDLFSEVAARHAEVFNDFGFDMIYLDALDGHDIFAGAEYAWHYSARFCYDILRNITRPVIMEMSTFHHLLWVTRARMGAWDTPSRAYPAFIDNHVAANTMLNRRMFLPDVLGWWALNFWSGPNTEPTFPEDIEYLCNKALADDAVLTLNGLTPERLRSHEGTRRLVEIIRAYEHLRRAGDVPEATRALLRQPGHGFALDKSGDVPVFRPLMRQRCRVEVRDDRPQPMHITVSTGMRGARLRIEALLSPAPYDMGAQPLLTAEDAGSFAPPFQHTGMALSVKRDTMQTPTGEACLQLSARNDGASRDKAWAMATRTFATPLNFTADGRTQAQGQAQLQHIAQPVGFGCWVYGDGKGETLNLRLRSPHAVTGAFADFPTVIDFTGWRYLQWVEQDAEGYATYRWPDEHHAADWQTVNDHSVLGLYEVYRESVSFAQIASAGLWLHHVDKEAAVIFGPVRALPLQAPPIRHPRLTADGHTLTFPVELTAGQYLEYTVDTATLYDGEGALLSRITPTGDWPMLPPGEHDISFGCDANPALTLRARISVLCVGE